MSKKHQDRPHQKDAIKAIVAGFKKNNRGQAIMACGTGKTRVGMRVAEVMEVKRLIVFVPSIALVAQFIRDWREQSQHDCRMLAVCSDGTVSAAESEDDLSIAQLRESSGVSVTTDPETVASFMRSRGCFVIFCTYVSGGVVESAQQRKKVPAFDLAICDEAHRCASHLSGPWCTIVRADSIRAKKRLFMTATPRVFRVKHKDDGTEEDTLAASMDDEDLFGPVLYRLGFAEAIKRGLLCDYRVVVTVVTDADVARLIKGSEHVNIGGEEFQARDLALHVAVHKAIKEHKLRKLISFHSRIYKAKDFAHQHRLAVHLVGEQTGDDKMWINHLSASFDSQERLRIITEFEGQSDKVSALLTNARCLTEGVDVPAVDGIVFADPRESVVAITQAVGRAMRLAPGKTVGTIVVPVFAEAAKAVENEDGHVSGAVFDDSSFQTVRRVLLALRMADDELNVMFSKLTAQVVRNSGVSSSGSRVSPRFVTEGELSEGLKTGTMVEASEEDNLVDHVTHGRTYDKDGREVVIAMPEKIAVTAGFARAIKNRIVALGTSEAERVAHEIVTFIKKNGRDPAWSSNDAYEKKLAKKLTTLRSIGSRQGYKD